MGVRDLLNRASEAVQETRQSVLTGVALSVVALIVAAVAFVVAVWRQ